MASQDAYLKSKPLEKVVRLRPRFFNLKRREYFITRSDVPWNGLLLMMRSLEWDLNDPIISYDNFYVDEISCPGLWNVEEDELGDKTQDFKLVWSMPYTYEDNYDDLENFVIKTWEEFAGLDEEEDSEKEEKKEEKKEIVKEKEVKKEGEKKEKKDEKKEKKDEKKEGEEKKERSHRSSEKAEGHRSSKTSSSSSSKVKEVK